MIPVLFKSTPDPVRLKASNGTYLKAYNGTDLYATGRWFNAMDFSSYGIGALSEAVSCMVSEERNGEYELELQYPSTGKYYEGIESRGIILAKPNQSDDPQPFRIYQISIPINGLVTVRAAHISYDLTNVPVGPFTASTASDACTGLMDYAEFTNPFTITTDLTTEASFAVNVPSSVRSWFGGKEGSMVDAFGGEWHFDGYTCTLKASRGQDRGMMIRYGYNLTDINQETNISNMYTGVLPYWVDNQTGEVVSGQTINVPGTFGFRRIYCYDVTQFFPSAPTKEQLQGKARSYINTNNIGVPNINITLDWVQTNETIDLCDTVAVTFERLGIQAKAKCIRTVWDVLKDRYDSFQFGDAKPTIAETIVELQRRK